MTRFFAFIGLAVISMALIPFIASGQTSKPAHPYGEPGLVQDFLCSEMEYPQSALESGQEGTVVISFTVGRDGAVSGARVTQSVSPELDAEAVRLFRMILWEPAISLGQPVASAMEFPVKFNIKKYQKHCKQRGYEHSDLPYEPVDTALKVYELSQVDKAPYPLFSEKGMNMGKFISANIRYPETAFRQNLFGSVVLRFVVEPQGRPSNILVINPVGGGCTQEAIRLLQQIQWMPALKEGTAVRCFNKLEIEFKLPDESDMKMFENTQMNSN
jgi:TonB family protein